jgi:hypothetical protein
MNWLTIFRFAESADAIIAHGRVIEEKVRATQRESVEDLNKKTVVGKALKR